MYWQSLECPLSRSIQMLSNYLFLNSWCRQSSEWSSWKSCACFFQRRCRFLRTIILINRHMFVHLFAGILYRRISKCMYISKYRLRQQAGFSRRSFVRLDVALHFFWVEEAGGNELQLLYIFVTWGDFFSVVCLLSLLYVCAFVCGDPRCFVLFSNGKWK